MLLGVPVPSHLLFAIIAAAGAVPVLSFAILARYFPKEVAGRANPALGVLNMGTAFGLQSLAGLIIAQWPADGVHYPAVAHQAAMAAGLGLQLISLGVFFTPTRMPQPIPMAHTVARALGIDPPTAEITASCYREALSAWRRHVVDARRQATAWRFAALASMALCVGLAGALSLALIHPAIALYVAESGSMTRVSAHAASVPFEEATVTAAPTPPKWLWQGAAAHD